MSGRNNYSGRGERGGRRNEKRSGGYGRQEAYGRGGRSDRRGGKRSGASGYDRRGRDGDDRRGYKSRGKNDRYEKPGRSKNSRGGRGESAERRETRGFTEFNREADFQRDHESGSEMIFGRNPVTEALKSGRSMEKILVQDTSGGSVGRILSLANENGVLVQKVSKQMLDHLAEGAVHQGVAAHVSAHEYASVEDILARAEERGEDPFIIILDGIEDPHNLGAIMRSAECAGAHGVIIQKRRAVGLTQTVAKASAGAIEYMPCARVTNISRTIEELKEKNVWVYACDMDGQNYTKQDLTGPIAIVIGAEGAGIAENVKKKCDGVVSLPMLGHITSLNASNAAAILMYEIRRQRDAQNPAGEN
ncbi:MAG: 23S rRNA (guanosine(2251)-2'-O)-methyltransferase RlmB [Eubacterium sp.]|nr:23S rRNA (guanosine(2251)-2'-O)-methyltransferase RlmB [Eubacterium sp.]MCH4046791.1 23S rRNA (guanosine(2251)-2'-O)-methyltransferase RlmB [Eubacterium sp.]MCH4079888.1 23S rRNA (guanosine(2251)-2'-O)-methyltransferase RlmB [Eubacterium sp.]MCH4110071.1 23S rRNA (guanosine(2251)-2'-O)-methyltransferase RlmB [Eubacterium sp.]MCI1306507.1 23S rRNA (guanosine(2251)-2'-O)-methyltransferase RlmB [Eubacterium sp.]